MILDSLISTLIVNNKLNQQINRSCEQIYNNYDILYFADIVSTLILTIHALYCRTSRMYYDL